MRASQPESQRRQRQVLYARSFGTAMMIAGGVGWWLARRNSKKIEQLERDFLLRRQILNSPLDPKFGGSDGDDSRDVIEEASWESFPASDPPALVSFRVRVRARARSDRRGARDSRGLNVESRHVRTA